MVKVGVLFALMPCWMAVGFFLCMAINAQRRLFRIIYRIKTMDLAVIAQGAEITCGGVKCFTTAEIAVRVPRPDDATGKE